MQATTPITQAQMYDLLVPVYFALAIVLALGLIGMAWHFIIKPFLRDK
jgi:hypothetical protein